MDFIKKALPLILHAKISACLFFTGFVLIWLITGLFMEIPALPLPLLWQYLALSLIGGVLQLVAFHPEVFPRIRYVGRLLLFGLPFLIALALFAYFGSWFPTGQFIAWFIFLVIFTLVFLIITLVFSIYHRITGQHYGLLLEQYKKEEP